MRIYTHRHFYSAALALVSVLALMESLQLTGISDIPSSENGSLSIAGSVICPLPVSFRLEPDSRAFSRSFAFPIRPPAGAGKAVSLR